MSDGIWRVMRFETANGKYAEVASNVYGPSDIPVPPNYRHIHTIEMVPKAELEEAQRDLADVEDQLDEMIRTVQRLRGQAA